ncbi:MAG: hypothetical protein AB1331_02895 [Bacillota bacterium]
MSLRKERRLPYPGTVLVQEDERVWPDTVIARAEYLRGDPVIISLNQELGVKEPLTPEQVDEVMVKKAGDRVVGQEIIARLKLGFFGEVKTAKARATGYIEYISRLQALVFIREDAREAEPLVVIPVAEVLGVPAHDTRHYARVREGDQVRAGQPLAAHTGALFHYKFVSSPVTGEVEKICGHSGTVTIRRQNLVAEVRAFISGRVVGLLPGEGAVIEAVGQRFEGVFGVGGEGWGRLEARSIEGLAPEDIDERVNGSVLAVAGWVSGDALIKALSLGCQGVVCGSLPEAELVRFLGRELRVGLTGVEDVAMPVVITEGFGRVTMRDGLWELLSSSAGQTASVCGLTQIRAGAIRPEVIIADDSQESYREVVQPPTGQALEPGQVVRVDRGPWFGRIGTVTRLFDGVHRFANGCEEKAVEIQFGQERRVIAVRNLRAI